MFLTVVDLFNRTQINHTYLLTYLLTYVKECRMEEVKEIMKIRLNMTELKPNFCGKYRDRICSACEKEDETTEHVIQCQEYKRLLGHELNCDEPIKELMNNTAWLREAAKVYRRIEETRQWLV